MKKKFAFIIALIFLAIGLFNGKDKLSFSEDESQKIAAGIAENIKELLDISGQDIPNQEGTEATHMESVLEVHFLDVGQADCTFITDGEHNLLIDAGTDDQGTKIQAYLTKRGVDKLDYLILTHPDSDHIGSADVIITKFPCDKIFISGKNGTTKTAARVEEALAYRNYKPVVPTLGDIYPFGDASITILGPDGEYEDTNDSSVCFRLDYGDTSFLFTGDASEKAEEDMVARWGNNLHVTVYKAGHHGSTHSSNEGFMDLVDPEYAVISCGEGNSYGHPHARVLNLLRENGIKTFRTDEQGTIVATSNGNTITWNCPPTDSWKTGWTDEK